MIDQLALSCGVVAASTFAVGVTLPAAISYHARWQRALVRVAEYAENASIAWGEVSRLKGDNAALHSRIEAVTNGEPENAKPSWHRPRDDKGHFIKSTTGTELTG